MKEIKNAAKKHMLKELSGEMSSMIGDRYKEGMKDKMAVKVTSDSPKGLKEGLSKAQEILKKRKSLSGEEYEEDTKEEESSEEEHEEESDKESLLSKIAKLEDELKNLRK